ncbi:hypothetical protein [Pseudomonas sp. CCI3.1]|uniref:hypothetical protein n=1 Tax=Pseudomonas sp. CCI3.1 TaxID=3048618 RepID=UPI002AB5C2E1|nr:MULTISPECIES: hypothetical protein [unclassified Pseudomonas]MDY7581180.1 hypothetical protein [Pseudomonas sp. CCI3.1]MEB0067061.1 hypothetical protein [Pseudomonas sp. CCI3.1]MEB0073001.1 hypothetical protein [Pseudomonas sp. CCI1.4]
MKFYLIKYAKELPNGFGGTAQGPLIKILPKYKDDIGLLEHEKVHVRQWYAWLALGLLIGTLLTLLVSPSLWPLFGLAPLLHQLLYKFTRPYRRWCEVQAYRKQIETGGYASNEFAVIMLVDKYDLGLSVDEARALLID